MEEILILPIEICRICSNLQSNLDIFTVKLEGEQVLLHEALEFVSCIKTDFDDGMSGTMCSRCCKRLSDAYKFKNQILDSYRCFYKQTSDIQYEKCNSIPDNDSAVSVVEDCSSINYQEEEEPALVRERANELGIKLSTDAVSFIVEHNSCKTRIKNDLVQVKEEENLDTDANAEQCSTENNDYENVVIEIIESEGPTQALDDQDTGELMKVELFPNTEASSNEDNQLTYLELPATGKTGELMKVETSPNTEVLSNEHNQLSYLESPAIGKTKAQLKPNARPPERNLTTPNHRTSQCSDTSSTTNKNTRNKPQKTKFSCHICHKILPKKSNLIDHMRLHANEKNFVCSYCQKAFVQVANYRTHLRVHTKERPFHCQLCPKTYSQAGSLKTHIRSHTNERNYVCNVCYKDFTSSSDLCKHKRIHDLSQHFTCETCGHLFSQKANLVVHERNVHFISRK